MNTIASVITEFLANPEIIVKIEHTEVVNNLRVELEEWKTAFSDFEKEYERLNAQYRLSLERIMRYEDIMRENNIKFRG